MTRILEGAPNEPRYFVEETDSMGRTQQQVEAMEKNALRPPRLGRRDSAHALRVAKEQATYPKVMYRLALKKGNPAGDEVMPSYPMPFDLAQSLGISDKGFKVLGKTRDSGGYIQQRYGYITTSVGVFVNDDPFGLIDHEASLKLEKKLRAEGWVDHPSQIEGLPSLEPEEDFDPLPAKKESPKSAHP